MILLILSLYSAWTMEVVTTETNLASPTIAVDSLGNPALVISVDRIFAPPMLCYLILYYKNNGNWLADTFESNAESNGVLVVDRYNEFWIMYLAYNMIDTIWYLVVAHKDSNGNWTKDTVEDRHLTQAMLLPGSIVTDSSGNPHIVYAGWTTFHQNQATYYAFLCDTLWQKEIVDSGYIGVVNGWAVDLDSQNRPQISYFGNGGNDLWSAKKNDSIWLYETVDPTNYANWWVTSIRVNPTTNLPTIAYKDPNTYQMKFAWDDGLAWHIDTVESVGGIRTQKALDIDSLGKPYIVYNNTVAYKDSTGWHYAPLPPLIPPLTQYAPGALRLGRDGIIHVSRLATNDDYTYREVHHIYGTPAEIEESNQVARNIQYILFSSPNPFERHTTVHYRFSSILNNDLDNQVSLKIFDVVGRLVKALINDHQQDGSSSITWNGRDENNHEVSSGIYFCMLKTETFCKTIKLIVLR